MKENNKPKTYEILGRRFGRLLIIDDIPGHGTMPSRVPRQAVYICDCGNEGQARAYRLWTGYLTSCGCITPDQSRLELISDLKTKNDFPWAAVQGEHDET